MLTGQATEAAKAGGLGNDGNAACQQFFSAPKGVALRRAPACVAPLGKASSLAVGARLAGSSPRNAMLVVAGWEIRA